MNPSLEVHDFTPPKENSAISDGSPSYSDLVTFDEEGPVEEPKISEDDAVLQQVQALLKDGYAGIIFTGAPGTSKSWYARQIGLRLTKGRMNDLYFVQFHPGYQYEDFIESYIPTQDGGFVLSKKTFLRACETATSKPHSKVVVVIDELTRTDVVRVFGEALTYLETSKRDFEFQLASGRFFRIPKNLIVICTMNPWDRGVDELDLAFERRFAKIAFDPNVDLLREMMRGSLLDARMKGSLEKFFFIVSRHSNPLCRIGHAYFERVTDIASLHRLWDNQLRFHFERIFRNEPDEYKRIQEVWSRIFDSHSE
ncbi:ATPase [Paraburkholderia sp. T12-10]|nr:ATPase [Paraburkholderia sp. T12-10]